MLSLRLLLKIRRTMADVFSKEKRSEVMKLIHGKNTQPEILVRKYLFSSGLRYRLHVESLPGKPDIVFKKTKTIIFINGCFWHGHRNCKFSKIPATNKAYWSNKISQNIQRDHKVIRMLRMEGWRIIIIWECMLRPSRRDKSLSKLYKDIQRT